MFSYFKKYTPFLTSLTRVVSLSLFISIIIRILSFIPLYLAYDVKLETFFDFALFSNIYNTNIAIFVISALWITLKLVLLAWAVSIGLAILFIFLQNSYFTLKFLWNLILSLGDIHVFGLFVIVQYLSSMRVPFVLLVLVLSIGSGTLKEMVRSFQTVYEDVIRKEYWHFMYSQGVSPIRIGFAELLVRLTELSLTRLPILLVGSILVEAASNTLGLGYYMLDVLKSLESNRVDLNMLTGISFTMILLVLLSQRCAEYVRVRFDPQSQVQR